jgi:hypothetical protein
MRLTVASVDGDALRSNAYKDYHKNEDGKCAVFNGIANG